MKKLLFVAIFGLAMTLLFASSQRHTPTALVSASVQAKKAGATIGVLDATSNKKMFNIREYSTACGVYSVSGTFTSTQDEQDKSNLACQNGWTWWKYDNGVFTGGTGTPPTS